MLLRGDCLEQLKTLEENSIHSLVTDPPAGISFMGKEWDHGQNFVERMSEIYKECLRVLKPGAHGLVWALPRTSHWTATALEQAGFEIRDVITHVFGSGFPKSLDISKAIDKAAGAEREVIGKLSNPSGGLKTTYLNNNNPESKYGWNGDALITSPSTPEAKQWQGWGTALKPASEHWILVRKKYNIDPCEEIVLSAIPNTQLTMHGLNEAEALLVHMLVESSLDPAQKAKILCVGRAVNGLDMTVMSQLTSVVESIDLNIVSSWKNISDEDLEKVKTFITSMATRRITESRISNSSQSPNTLDCIKPNSEHYILIRKPLSEKTVAANVLKWGCGGLNIDASRIESVRCEKTQDKSSVNSVVKNPGPDVAENCKSSAIKSATEIQGKEDSTTLSDGLIQTDTCASNIGTIQRESIVTSSSTDTFGVNQSQEDMCFTTETKTSLTTESKTSSSCSNQNTPDTTISASPSGRFPSNFVLSHNEDCDETCTEGCSVRMLDEQSGASRFFYCAKASKKDRNEGLEGMPEVEKKTLNSFGDQKNFDCPDGANRKGNKGSLKQQNFHPTVKSTKLMEYLITLVTPPNGTVLDPFMGSGSTCVAAKRLGFEFIGIEQNEEYFEIAERRVEHEIHKTRAHI